MNNDKKKTSKSSKNNIKNVNFNKKGTTSKINNFSQKQNTNNVKNKKVPTKKKRTSLIDFSNNNQKINNEADEKNLVKPKHLFISLASCIIIFICLFFRIGFLQFVQGAELKENANRQQTTNRIISPKRGNIYDSTGKVLARSAAVDTVSVSPTKIANEDKEITAKALSEIFELDYEETLRKVKNTSNIETIAKKVEKEKIDKLKSWMKETEITSGINIDEDAKRYYPYDNLASNLIGFCGTDNQGLWGLELYWENELSGTPGKIVAAKDVSSGLVPDKEGTYVPAENGSNLTLTLDLNIQTIVEKYLKQAVIENDCKNGGNVIIMNPKNGDILAMASYPDYNLNTPFEPNETLAPTWETLSDTEKNNALNRMWGNRNVSDGYEPGSTFKVITAAIGLEEGIVDTDTQNDFVCRGVEQVTSNFKIKCWKDETTHGYQTLRNALENSCNPALMQLGKKIGAETLYKYYSAFGFFSSTGIPTSGEPSNPSNFWNLENVGPIELATMSFGQRFTITPIQLVAAISSIANDGVLMQPRIVKQIENSDTHAITTVEPVAIRQVVSKETANKVVNMLESVVNDGTGGYGKVSGYSIAGKTGTSEPNPAHPEDGYVASYVAIAPSQDPELVILVALYNPKGASHQGGQIAGPVVSQILTEVLPYLNIPSDYVDSGTSNTNLQTTFLPDVRNKTIAQAKSDLEKLGFICNISTSDTTKLISDQVPKPGAELIQGACINLYSSDSDARISQEVPNLKGKSVSQANNMLKARNLNIHVSGTGTILSQDPMAGTLVEEGTVINVTLKQEIQDAH